MGKKMVGIFLLMCLAGIGVLLSSVAWGDDTQRVQNTIDWFYREGAAGKLVEERFVNLVTEDFTRNFSRHGFLVYLLSKDAQAMEVVFEETDVQDDTAATIYTLCFIDSNGEEWMARYITRLVRDDGRWKIASTSG
jgi:hypothetical protein